ncbi:ATP-dependent chaperone ClpB, partial [Candidatus Saccharibacteria bacterium SW_7_54_9]
VGSFLFLGPTGVGKTELSKSLAALYFGGEDRMIRVDMSEYNQPESTQRLLAPAGQEAGLLTAMRMQPFSVVLLDEVEKASDDVLNLLLQMLDEGQLTDVNGKTVSFRDAIVITTSNAGADTIRSFIEEGYDLKDFSQEFIDQLISDQQFKAELINRFDEVVLFRPLPIAHSGPGAAERIGDDLDG